MRYHVVDKEVRQVNAGSQRGHQHEQCEGDQVRRIEPAKAATPESPKLNRLRLLVSARFGPLQVNTEAGNNEEEKDADVAKGADKLQKLYGPAKDIGWDRTTALPGSVVENNA